MVAKNHFDIEIKNDNQIVSNWLLYYHELREDYLDQREDIIHYQKTGKIFKDRPQGSPTESKGRKLIDNLQNVEQWLKLIEEVENSLPANLKVFLELRRQHRNARGRIGWTATVQQRFPEELSKLSGGDPESNWIESRNTFTRWWDRIVEFTARIAIKRGLL